MRFGYLFFAAAIVSIFALEGCAPGGKAFPEPSAGFEPKVTYPVSLDRSWQAALTTLNANSLPIATASKDTGQIATGYIEGTSGLRAGGLLGAITSRYKYTLIFISEGPARTRVNVVPVLEATSIISPLGTATSTPFRDISADNPKIVGTLRNWMYQELESRF